MTNSRNFGKVLSWLILAGVLLLAVRVGRQPSIGFLALGVGGVGLLFLVRRPGLGLVALAALSFTVPVSLGTGTEVALTPPVLLVPVVAVAWLLDGLRRRSLRLPASRATLPLLLFVAGGLASLLAGTLYWDPLVPRSGNLLLVQLAQWGIYALSALIFLLAGDLGSRGRWLEWATWTFLAVGSVVVLEFYLPPLQRVLGWSGGLMANRSLFWTWLAALAAGQLFFNRRLSTLAKLSLMLLLVGAAFVAWFVLRDWISGWVPFSVAALTVVWLRVRSRNRTAATLALLAMVALAVVLYPLLFVHAGGEQEVETSWGGRQLLYRRVLDLVKDHPLLGLGPAAYRHYGFTQWLTGGVGTAFWVRPNISSHNNYIDIYAQMGLVGLGLFIWFLIAVGRVGWRLRAHFHDDFAAGYVNGALGGLAGTLVAMMLADWFLPFVYNISFPGFRTSVLAWMFLGGLVALEQVSRATREQGGSGR